jgi:tRNA pseudouridine38-40 synthase
MARYKLTIAYDGTQYCGWQVQTNGPAIQPIVQKALQTTLRHEVGVTGAGRTDTGVHAQGQTAHFDTEKEFDSPKLLFSLNGLLPKDIRILQIDAVAPNFHARYSAQSKIYHYHLHLHKIANPFLRLYRYQVFQPLNLSLLKEASQIFLGTHDFTSFANDHQQGAVLLNPIRTMFRLDVVEEEGGARLEFEADGFFYKMVRNITGALVKTATGKIYPSDLACILAAKDRRKAPPTAPPQGLFLMKVVYRYGQTTHNDNNPAPNLLVKEGVETSR